MRASLILRLLLHHDSVKVTKERLADSDGAKFTAKKEAKKSSNENDNKVDGKKKSEKLCTVAINTSRSFSLI